MDKQVIKYTFATLIITIIITNITITIRFLRDGTGSNRKSGRVVREKFGSGAADREWATKRQGKGSKKKDRGGGA